MAPRNKKSHAAYQEPLMDSQFDISHAQLHNEEGVRPRVLSDVSSESHDDEGGGHAMPASSKPTQHVSWLRIVAINAHAFNYGLFYASVGVILLPEEALIMFEGSHAVALAAMLVLGGVSQLISPIAGYASDRTSHWLGRRMPFILAGNFCLFISLGFMYVARTNKYGYVYLFLLLIAMISLNVAYTGFAGLVSDVVPDSQMGVTSGIMGGMTAAGAVLGLVGLGFIIPLPDAYAAYALSVAVTTPLTWIASREVRLDPSHQRPYVSSEIIKSYYISPASHGDFFWVFCSRTGYYMAVSTQIYILYYLRDCMDDPEVAGNAKTYTAILCILSQGCSGLVSLIAGHATSRFGYKPLIYAACTVMAMVYGGYTLVHTFPLVVALGVCYGSSNGVYLAADYALAVECLPSKDDGAKDLALWGIAAFLGTMFGPCITGPTLSIIGEQEGSTKYLFRGYVAVMCLGIVYSGLASVFLCRVKHGEAPRSARGDNEHHRTILEEDPER